jgi:hypothetical protein
VSIAAVLADERTASRAPNGRVVLRLQVCEEKVRVVTDIVGIVSVGDPEQIKRDISVQTLSLTPGVVRMAQARGEAEHHRPGVGLIEPRELSTELTDRLHFRRITDRTVIASDSAIAPW